MRLPDEPPLSDALREIARRDDAAADERRAAQARSFADGLRRAANATATQSRAAAGPPAPQPSLHEDPVRAMLARRRALAQPTAERGRPPLPGNNPASAKSDSRRPPGTPGISRSTEQPGQAPPAPVQPDPLEAATPEPESCPAAAMLQAAQSDRAADTPAPSGPRKRRFAHDSDSAASAVAAPSTTACATPIAETAAVSPAPTGSLQHDSALTGLIEYARLAQTPGEALAFHIGVNGLVPGGVRIVVATLRRRRISLRLSSRVALDPGFVDGLLELLSSHDIAVADCAVTCSPGSESA